MSLRSRGAKKVVYEDWIEDCEQGRYHYGRMSADMCCSFCLRIIEHEYQQESPCVECGEYATLVDVEFVEDIPTDVCLKPNNFYGGCMIIRYDPTILGDMESYPHGNYVTYEDYEKLEVDLKDLQRKHKAMLEKLNQIIWEGGDETVYNVNVQ